MATTTPNFGLRKPTNNDTVNVATDISGNMDLLDAHAHSGTYVRVGSPIIVDAAGAGDYTTLAAAVAAASAGDTIRLRSNLTVTDTVTVDKALTIDGASHTITLSDAPTAGALKSQSRVLSVSAQTGVVIKDVTFQAPTTLTGYTLTGVKAIIYLLNTVACEVSHCTFNGLLTSFTSMAVWVSGTAAADNRIVDNRISGVGIIYAYDGATRTVCSRNYIADAWDDALNGVGNNGGGTPTQDCIVHNNVILRAGRMGIEDWGGNLTRRTSIQGNVIFTTGSMGISAVGVNTLVSGNTVVDSNTNAIEAGSNGHRIIGNTCRQVTNVNQYVGIIVNGHVTGVSTSTVVQGNYVEGFDDAIVLYDDFRSVTIDGNILVDYKTYGIWPNNIVSSPTRPTVIISNNVFRCTATTALGSGSQRQAINANTAGMQVRNNSFVWESAAGNVGGALEWALRVTGNDISIIGNRFDANGIAAGGSAPAAILPFGSTATGLSVVDNTTAGGATVDTSSFTTPFVFGNNFANANVGLVNADIATGAAIAQSKIATLTTDLAAKATDTLAAHLAGTETLTGTKTFTATAPTKVTAGSLAAGANLPATAIRLTGAASNFVSTPDSVGISITGDLELQGWIAPDDWTPASNQAVMAKWNDAGNQRGIFLRLDTDGRLRLLISTTGVDSPNGFSSVLTGVTDGVGTFIRVTRVQTSGLTSFYTSPDGTTWTAQGTATISAGSAIFDNTAAFTIGTLADGSTPFAGYVASAKILASIGGASAASFDASAVNVTDTRTPTTSTQGGTVWTFNGSAWSWLTPALAARPGTAGTTGLAVQGVASQNANLQHWQDSTGAVLSTISENGYFTTRKTAAPADAELLAGEAAFWFDATNGAAKLMVKAKQADGTVKTGSVTLS